jgi:hypothetical protein
MFQCFLWGISRSYQYLLYKHRIVGWLINDKLERIESKGGICLEELKNSKKILGQNSQSSSRDANRIRPEYNSSVLPLAQPARLVQYIFVYIYIYIYINILICNILVFEKWISRFRSAGLWHRVDRYVVTKDLEESTVCIFSVKMKIEEVDSTETSVTVPDYIVLIQKIKM